MIGEVAVSVVQSGTDHFLADECGKLTSDASGQRVGSIGVTGVGILDTNRFCGMTNVFWCSGEKQDETNKAAGQRLPR